MKKLIMSLIAAAALAAPAAAFAAGGPTPGPEAGPGCFGNWRAGSVQEINGHAPGTDNAGQEAFSQRKGDNSTINAENRATCAALG
jgi:hypothetical protein